jgi:hypothetical protein
MPEVSNMSVGLRPQNHLHRIEHQPTIFVFLIRSLLAFVLIMRIMMYRKRSSRVRHPFTRIHPATRNQPHPKVCVTPFELILVYKAFGHDVLLTIHFS